MSKKKVNTPSRWTRRNSAYREFRQKQAEKGLIKIKAPSLPNHKCTWKSLAEEQQARQEAIEAQIKALRPLLPTLLSRFSRIEDPRRPGSVKHKLTVLLLLGIVFFVYQMGSRREGNRTMSKPMLMENLKTIFPELETLPHADTLNRLLIDIEVEQIEEAHIELVKKLIRNKKLQRYLVGKGYLIAIDGTRKFARDYCWAEECLKKKVPGQDEKYEYYVYVLEANLVFPGGLSLPLMSEFLDNTVDEGLNSKQDCEQKGFKRLAKRLKEHFPRLSIKVLLDGLYPGGPVFEICRKNHWQFMIVLQDGNLPSVWADALGLHKIEPENSKEQMWGNRNQKFWWANEIVYTYQHAGRTKNQILHLVVCEESWEELNQEHKPVQMKSRHAWISSEPINRGNVHKYCNLQARHRWGIETNILVEKRQGYQYEHVYSYNWNAMKGYHYLMRLAHLLNNLAFQIEEISEMVREMGVRGLISFLKETLTGPWLNVDRIKVLLGQKLQLRLQ